MQNMRIDHGVQPAKLVIVQRRLQIKDIAARIGYTPWWMSVILDGRANATPRFRTLLSVYLDLDEAELFNYGLPEREPVPS